MQATGAETVKVAVKANRLSDCVPLLDLAARARGGDGLIAIAMGPHGLATRVLPARFGSRWTYAGEIDAVGQLTAESLLNTYRFRSIGPSTRIYGLVGGGSLSAFVVAGDAQRRVRSRACGCGLCAVSSRGRRRLSGLWPRARHQRRERDDPAQGVAVRSRRRGVSGREPHRRDQHDSRRGRPVDRRQHGRHRIPRAAQRSDRAPRPARVRARRRRRGACGDRGPRVDGLQRAFARPQSGRRPRTWRFARRSSSAPGRRSLAAGTSWSTARRSGRTRGSTTLRSRPASSPAATSTTWSTTRPRRVCVRDAAAAGCQALGGLEMLVAQAEEQFQWWTDVKPPKGVMREAATKRLAEFTRDENYVV